MIRLPQVAVALARVDRAAYYTRLHAQDSVFLLEEPRSWLVIGYEEVAQLLGNPRLASGRNTVMARLCEWAEAPVASEFYRQWLMYLDGGSHAEWRRRFVRAVSAQQRDRVHRSLPGVDTLSARLSAAQPARFTEVCIRPFVFAELAAFAGVRSETIAHGYEMLEPILSALHGRGIRTGYSEPVAQALYDWPNFLEFVRKEVREQEPRVIGAMLAQGDSLRACGVALLPFIDVVDALVSLCGRTVVDAIRNRTRGSDLTDRELVREAVRLHSPFLCCNRVAAESLSGPGGLMCAAGDHVTLLIGAANRDPRVFPEPDVARSNRGRPALSFGFGAHTCPGRAWSYGVLERFQEILKQLLRDWPECLRVDELTYFDEPGFAGVDTVTLRLETS